MTPKAARKRQRRRDNNWFAREARFWRKPGSAERMGHTRPIDRQAAKELKSKPRKEPK